MIQLLIYLLMKILLGVVKLDMEKHSDLSASSILWISLMVIVTINI